MKTLITPLRQLYEWMLSLGQKSYALPALAILAFAESIFFPLPLEVLLLPMILGARHRVVLFVCVAAVFSALGAVGGYYLGVLLQDAIYAIPGVSEKRVQPLEDAMAQGGAWIIATGALTIIPFKVTTIAAGLFSYPSVLMLFVWSLVFRGFRYAVIGILLYFFGAQAKVFIDRWFGWLCLLAIFVIGLLVWWILNH